MSADELNSYFWFHKCTDGLRWEAWLGAQYSENKVFSVDCSL